MRRIHTFLKHKTLLIILLLIFILLGVVSISSWFFFLIPIVIILIWKWATWDKSIKLFVTTIIILEVVLYLLIYIRSEVSFIAVFLLLTSPLLIIGTICLFFTKKIQQFALRSNIYLKD